MRNVLGGGGHRKDSWDEFRPEHKVASEVPLMGDQKTEPTAPVERQESPVDKASPKAPVKHGRTPLSSKAVEVYNRILR
ncbi:MAG: hypothetical protein NTU61_05720, partial [Candidatus Altiarchaeota archaeon]|nr:hypothetical protein [Candidatus Altiarchaeota archaeon]